MKVYVDIGQMVAQLVVGQRRETAEPAPEQLFRMGNLHVRPDEGNVNGLVAVAARSRIRIVYPSRIPDPGVKKAPDPGSATLLQDAV